MERTSKEEVNIPSIKEIRLERRRLARQNRKRRIFFNTTITWDGTNRCWCYLNGWSSSSSYHKETC